MLDLDIMQLYDVRRRVILYEICEKPVEPCYVVTESWVV